MNSLLFRLSALNQRFWYWVQFRYWPPPKPCPPLVAGICRAAMRWHWALLRKNRREKITSDNARKD